MPGHLNFRILMRTAVHAEINPCDPMDWVWECKQATNCLYQTNKISVWMCWSIIWFPNFVINCHKRTALINIITGNWMEQNRERTPTCLTVTWVLSNFYRTTWEQLPVGSGYKQWCIEKGRVQMWALYHAFYCVKSISKKSVQVYTLPSILSWNFQRFENLNYPFWHDWRLGSNNRRLACLKFCHTMYCVGIEQAVLTF